MVPTLSKALGALPERIAADWRKMKIFEKKKGARLRFALAGCVFSPKARVIEWAGPIATPWRPL
eukprot:2591306-Prorocentrum_lima.AAC.1